MARIRRVLLFVLLTQGGCVRPMVRPPDEFNMSYRQGSFAVRRELSLVDTLSVGDHPKSVNISPDRRYAYVCNLEQGAVDIIQTGNGRRVRQIVFPRTAKTVDIKGKSTTSFEEKPVEIGFTGQGRYVWISLLNAGGVVVYDTRGEALSDEVETRTAVVRDLTQQTSRTVAMRFFPTSTQPKIVAVPDNERYVFVANWKGQSVTVIDPTTFKKIKDIQVGSLPRGICFTATSAFVANFGSHTLSEIDLDTLRRVRTIANVGQNPRHLITARDGDTLYLSNHGDGVIREIDAKSGRTIRQCAVGAEPRTIALSRRQNFLFVTNYHDDTLTVLDLLTMSEVVRVPTVRRPIGVSVDPESDTVWVTGYWDRVVRRYRFQSLIERMAWREKMGPMPG